MSGPMIRCECHDVPFSRVARHAAKHPHQEFETVMAKAGCGQTCTACHCDLKAYLEARQAQPVPALARREYREPATVAA
jgi:bacterioferritin-associated ferredoxin